MSVMRGVRAHLVALMEGTAAGVDRAIPAGRFLHVEDDGEQLPPGMDQAPYPFELADGGSFAPLDVPSTLSGSHVYDGRLLTVRVAYSPDLGDAEERERVITDDIATIRRCLRHQQGWDAVAVDNGGEGVTQARVASDGWGWAELATTEGAQPLDRLLVLELHLELTIREDHTP